MNWFHHPDVSLPVVANRAATELLDSLAWYGEFVLTRGRSAWRHSSYTSRSAYWDAVRRLRKKGIVAYRRKGGRDPVLRVTPVDLADQAVHHPERWWNARWPGFWYVLVYDVPERNRSYREHLRRVLLQQRCGCLQGSVWISTRDLRPLFADLDEAAALGSMAHLLEARTVLGRGSSELVRESWDFDRIGWLHARYERECRTGLQRVKTSALDETQLANLAREEAAAYRIAMTLDPLLPRQLHPPDYRGPAVHALHGAFVDAVRLRARTAHIRPL